MADRYNPLVEGSTQDTSSYFNSSFQIEMSNFFNDNYGNDPIYSLSDTQYFQDSHNDLYNNFYESQESAFNTELDSYNQLQYDTWKSSYEDKFNTRINEQDYDWRGYFKSINGAIPSTPEVSPKFTKPNHMFFSEDSIYNGANGFLGGRWEEDTFIQGHNKFYDDFEIQEYLDNTYADKSYKVKGALPEGRIAEYALEGKTPALSDIEAARIARERGDKTASEHFQDFIMPDKDNAFFKSLAIVGGAGTLGAIGQVIGSPFGPVGAAAGRILFGLAGAYFAGDITTRASGDYKRRQEVLESSLKLNAGEYSSPDEYNNLMNTITEWANEEKIESYRKDSSFGSSVVDSLLDVVVYGAEFAAPGKAVTKSIQIMGRGAATVLTRGQMGLAKGLNPKATKLWLKTADEMAEAQAKGIKFRPKDRALADLVFNGPLKVTSKQSSRILKQLDGLDDIARAKALPGLLKQQVLNNQKNWINNGDKIISGIRRLRNPQLIAATVGGTLVTRQSSIKAEKQEEYLKSMQFVDGKFVFDEDLLSGKNELKRQVRATNQILIERFTDPVLGIIGRSKAYRNTLKPVIDKVLKDPASKLGGATGINKALDKIKNTKLGKQFDKGARFQKMLHDNLSIESFSTEVFEEYLEIVSEAAFDFDGEKRKEAGISYLDNLADAFLFPVKNPREAAVIAATVGIMPVGAAALGTVTGAQTTEERKRLNRLMRQIYDAQGKNVSEQEAIRLIENVYGVGTEAFNNATMKGGILGKILDPVGSDISKTIFGTTSKEFNRQVNRRAEVLADGKEVNDNHINKAIGQLVSETIVFRGVAKDQTTADYLNVLEQNFPVHQMILTDQEGNAETFLDIVETTNQGKNYKFQTVRKVADPEVIEEIKQASKIKAAVDTKQVKITPAGKLVDIKTNKFLSKKETAARGVEAEAQGISNIITETGRILDKTVSLEKESSSSKKLKANSKNIDKSIINKIISARNANNKQDEKIYIDQLKNQLKSQLNISTKFTGKFERGFIKKDGTSLPEVDIKINDFIERVIAGVQRNPDLKIKSVSDSFFIGSAVKETGRDKGGIVEAFNEGNTIYVSGLSFASDPTRAFDEEAREVDIKSKFKGKALLTNLSSEAVQLTIRDLEERIKTAEGDERRDIQKTLDELQSVNKFEAFVAISQALSKNGKKSVIDGLKFIKDETKIKLNAAVYAEYSDSIKPSVISYMSTAEKRIAKDSYIQWKEEGGRLAADALTKIEIPEEFLSEERRQFLETNQVKLYDPKTKTSRSYFLGEDGWVNNQGRAIKNLNLIDKLDQRLQDKAKPVEQTRGAKNLRKLEKRLSFYKDNNVLEKLIDVEYALSTRLENSSLDLTDEQRKATNIVLKEVETILKDTGTVSASTSLHDLNYEGFALNQQKVKRLLDEPPIKDVTFSVDGSYSDPVNPGENISQEMVDEDADHEVSFEQDFFGATGKGTIASFIQSKYGARNGSLIIWGIRKSGFLEDIATNPEALERFKQDPGNQDTYHERLLRRALNNEYTDPVTQQPRQITIDDVYEFWRLSQSYNLVPFVTVLDLQQRLEDGTKVSTPLLKFSNENDMFKIVKRNAVVNLSSQKIDTLVQQLVEGDDLFQLLEDILGIDKTIIERYNAMLQTNNLLKILAKEKAPSKSIENHLKSLIGIDKLTHRGGTILQAIAPLLKKEQQLKTRFRNRNKQEQSAIIGDSHFISSLNQYIDETIGDELTISERQQAIALLDSVDVLESVNAEKLYSQEQQKLFERSISHFKGKYYYQFLPAFAEKEKVGMVLQKYLGNNKKNLLKKAQETKKFIQENIATLAGQTMYKDPVELIKKMKADRAGNLSFADSMTAHQLINMPIIMDSMVGDVSAYVKVEPSKDVSVEEARYINTINLIARHSQVSTDGVRHKGAMNIIQVPEIALTDYENADGLDGQMMVMESLMEKLMEDFGPGLHTGSSSEGIQRKEDGSYELDYIKGHISASIKNEENNNVQKSRILVKTNMWNPTIMQETTSRPDGKSQLDDIIRLVRAYNKDKEYDDQIHAVAFPSGAKLFPGETTQVTEDFDPKIIRVGEDSSIIKTTNLRHGISAVGRNRMFKQQHAQLGILNNEAEIITQDGTSIVYSGNGIKAARLREEVTDNELDKLDLTKNLNDLVSEISPAYIREAVDRGESLNDPRYASWLFEQLNIRIKTTSIPSINRVALQTLGGLDGTPPAYGPTQEGGFFKTSRIKANVKYARYNTYTNTKDIEKVKEFINKNRRFFYDMYYVGEDGYPTNDIMIHELDTDSEGNYIIPGEYTIQTRIPSGSLASHSFGRLTEPASKSFKNINIIVTNEGIRIAKGEDFDGDKSYVHLMARSIDKTVENPMYRTVNGSLELVNENGTYNLLHTYDSWNENNPKKKESNESKLNRAMGLEFAIWHTEYARAGYDIIGDIPKSAFDAEVIGNKTKDVKEIGNIDISSPQGLAKIHSIFKNRKDSTGIFAKVNSTYSWLSSVPNGYNDTSLTSKRSLPLTDLTQGATAGESNKEVEYDLEIPKELNFDNLFSVKRALEVLLNRSIDDNKEAKLFLMNLNRTTDGAVAFLLMTNIKANDLPRNNNNFAERLEGEDVEDSFNLEVSTAGDAFGKQFSALNAKFESGETVEEIYQLDVKGYRNLGYTWQQAKKDKGRKAPFKLTPEELEEKYTKVWRLWAEENPQLMNKLVKKIQQGAVLTDKFASKGGVSQARSLTILANEIMLREGITAKGKGAYKYQAYKDILKVLKYINSDKARDIFNRIEEIENDPLNQGLGRGDKFHALEIEMNRKYGDAAGSFAVNIHEYARAMRELSNVMDAAFEAPRNVDELNTLLRTSTGSFIKNNMNEELRGSVILDLAHTNKVKYIEALETVTSLNLGNRVNRELIARRNRIPYKKRNLNGAPFYITQSHEKLLRETLDKAIILNSIKELTDSKEENLESFVRRMKEEAFSIFDKTNEKYSNDRKREILKTYMEVTTGKKGTRRGKKIISLKEIFSSNELTPEIISLIQDSFSSLSYEARVALTTYMVSEYGLQTTNFNGSIFGMIGSFSKDINSKTSIVSEKMAEGEPADLFPQITSLLADNNTGTARGLSAALKSVTYTQSTSKTKQNVSEYVPPKEETVVSNKEKTNTDVKIVGNKVIREKLFTPELLRANPNMIYLFEDNLKGTDNADQSVIRNEPNAIGIPTKKNLSTEDSAYFTDTEYKSNVESIDKAFSKIPEGKIIVLPENGIGTGLAELQERAPLTHAYLQRKLDDLNNRSRITGVSSGSQQEFNNLPDPVPGVKNMVYTGVGARETPPKIQKRLKAFGKRLKELGYTVRTGDAVGADAAFREADEDALVFTRRDATDRTKKIATEIHPDREKLRNRKAALEFMARNTNQVFGSTLESPSDFLLCWTPDGWEGQQGDWIDLQGKRRNGRLGGRQSGTNQAIDYASRKGIPVFNLANKDAEDRFTKFIKGEESKQEAEDVTFSIRVADLVEEDSYLLKPKFNFEWENRLLNNNRRNLFDSGVWSLDKMLAKSNVPAEFRPLFDKFVDKEGSLEDMVSQIKSMFDDNISLELVTFNNNFNESFPWTQGEDYDGDSFDERFFIKNPEIKQLGSGLPLSFLTAKPFTSDNQYRVLVLKLKGVDQHDLVKRESGRGVLGHNTLQYQDMIGWIRFNTTPSSVDLIEYQSDALQRWGLFSKHIEPESKSFYMLNALATKDSWIKAGTDMAVQIASLVKKELSFPTKESIISIQKYWREDVDKHSKVYRHYEKMTEFAADSLNGFAYQDEGRVLIDAKELEDKTWSSDPYVPANINESPISLDGIEVTARDKILTEDMISEMSKTYEIEDKRISKAVDFKLTPQINWDEIAKQEHKRLRGESFFAKAVISEDKFNKRLNKRFTKIKDLIDNYPEFLEDGNQRFIKYYENNETKEKEETFEFIAKKNWEEAIENARNVRLKSEIIEHMAIFESIEARPYFNNHILLQTNRKEYGIESTQALARGKRKVKEIIFEEFTDPETGFYNEEVIRVLFENLTKLEGTPLQQYEALAFVEDKLDKKNPWLYLKMKSSKSDVKNYFKVLSSMKKYLRLINGVPTNNEMEKQKFVKPYADIENDPVTYSMYTSDILLNQATLIKNTGFNSRYTRKGMQEHLIDSTRTADVIMNNGTVLINNLLRLTGGKDLFTKDEKGNFKRIKTNKKYQQLGKQMRVALTYLVENYSKENDDWKNIQVIDPEVFERGETREVFKDEETGKYKANTSKGFVTFETIGEMVERIEQSRIEMGATHLLSFAEKDLESTIQEVRNIFEELYDQFNDMTGPLNEQFIAHKVNYIPHGDNDLDSSSIPKSKRETAKAEMARKYDTWFEMFEGSQLMPRITLDVAELAKLYTKDTAKKLRDRLAISTMAMVGDTDLMPMMLIDDIQELGIISDKVAHELSDQLLLGMKGVDKDFEFKDITYKDGYERLSKLVSQINPSKYGYKKVKTNYRNVKNVYVKEGAPSSIVKHIFNDSPMFEQEWANKAFSVIEKINLIGKLNSVSFSLFHPFALWESYVAIQGLDNFYGRSNKLHGMGKKSLREFYANLATNPEALSEWKAVGLKTDIGRAPDANYAEYQSMMTKFSNYLLKKKDPFTKLLGASVKSVTNLKNSADQLMWEVVLPMMKVNSANMLYLEALEQIDSNEIAYDKKQLKSDIAQFVNDAFGNQEWEQYIGANPARRRILNQLLFAPDWTLSALNVSGVSHIGGINRVLGSPTSDIHQKIRAERYWTNFAGLVLIAIPAALQYGITSLAAATGNGDEDDELWTFNNEKGQKLSVDVTPLFRTLGIYDQMGSSGQRRMYLRWGKQAYEVFEGWLTDPIGTVAGKSSIGTKIIMEQFMDTTKPGWQAAWANTPFFESIISVDGNVWDGRLAQTVIKFLPFSTYPVIEAITGKDPSKIKPPAFFAPIKFGTSEYGARLEVASIAKIYAEGSIQAKLKGLYPEQSLYKHTEEILDAAKKNGYDPSKVFEGGISLARSHYYKQFSMALKEGEVDNAIDAADKLHALNTKYSALKRSVKGQFVKQEGVYDIPANKMVEMYTAWQLGYKRSRKRGMNNYNIEL